MGKNGDIVKSVYDALARGDVPAVLGTLDSRIQWREAEGFLYADGNPYIGPQAVADGVFQRIAADIENSPSFLRTSSMVVMLSSSKDDTRGR